MSRLVLVETVFTPRMVVVPAGGLHVLRQWAMRWPGLSEELQDLEEAIDHLLCHHGLDPDEPAGCALRRSEQWWDLQRWARDRGWRVARKHGWVVDDLPVFALCTCGGC